MTQPDFDTSAILEKNKRALKDTSDDGEVSWLSFDKVVLIGDDHPQEYFDWVTAQSGYNHGLVTVKKGSGLGAGSLTFNGDNGGGRAEVEAHIAEFSNKKVIWA